MSDEYVGYYASLYFKAYNHGISRSYEVSPDEDKKIPSAYKNPDHYTVWCYHCACYMCYHNEPGTLLDGYYECPECGKRIKEESLYICHNREIDEEERQEAREADMAELENDNDWD